MEETILDIRLDLSHVVLMSTMHSLNSCGLLLTAVETHSWLCSQRNLVGWTYSLNPLALRVYDFKQLIVGRPVKVGEIKTKIKQANNSHLKCYIAQEEMVIGSYNLTAPTIEDLCIVVKSRKEIKHMRSEFNKAWKSL